MKQPILLLAIYTVISLTSCSNNSEVCGCFENRLAIKEQLESGGLNDLTTIMGSESYKAKKEIKKACLEIEAAYFKPVRDKYNSEKEMLRAELGSCDAAINLLDNY